MYENSRFLKNRFTFCGVNTNFGQQWAPPAYYHLTPIVSKGKHCSMLTALTIYKPFFQWMAGFNQVVPGHPNPYGKSGEHTALGRQHKYHHEIKFADIIYINGFVKDCSDSRALAMEFLQLRTKPAKFEF